MDATGLKGAGGALEGAKFCPHLELYFHILVVARKWKWKWKWATGNGHSANGWIGRAGDGKCSCPNWAATATTEVIIPTIYWYNSHVGGRPLTHPLFRSLPLSEQPTPTLEISPHEIMLRANSRAFYSCHFRFTLFYANDYDPLARYLPSVSTIQLLQV